MFSTMEKNNYIRIIKFTWADQLRIRCCLCPHLQSPHQSTSVSCPCTTEQIHKKTYKWNLHIHSWRPTPVLGLLFWANKLNCTRRISIAMRKRPSGNCRLWKGDIWIFFLFMYDIQHCFICRPSDSTVLEDAGIEPRTVATTALAVRRSRRSARSHPQATDLIHNRPQTYLRRVAERFGKIRTPL